MTKIVPNSVSAQKVAYRHYKSFLADPVEGVIITQLDALLFHVSTNIRDGIYEGLSIHWELKIPENYPFSPPFGEIVPGYRFGSSHHHHVFEKIGICADFLGNFSYMQRSAGAGTGWTSSCDFVGLMINMQAFFADPDGVNPSQQEIIKLHQMDSKFKCLKCKEHYENDNEAKVIKEAETIVEAESTIVKRARRELFCSVLKSNVVDDPELCLGYPVLVYTDKYKRIHSELYPEPLSYDAYMSEFQDAHSSGKKLRTSTGNTYTNWLPMYINEARFKRNLPIIQTTLSVIAKGPSGGAENDFKPEHILKVLPALMNQQVVALMNGSVHHSESVINAYVSLLRIFKRLLALYPSIQQSVDNSVSRFLKSRKDRTKKIAGDIGEFLIKMSLVSPNLRDSLSYSNPEMKAVFLEEYFARQIRWINKKEPDAVAAVSSSQTFSSTRQVDLLKSMFAASDTSNRLLVFNLQMASTFIVPQFSREVDKNYGLAPENIIKSFQLQIQAIKTKLVNYSTMMKAIKYDATITNAAEMISFLKRAILASAQARYD